MAQTLNEQMQFDHVVQVHTDGTVTDVHDVYAPEIYTELDSEGQHTPELEREMIDYVRSQGWELLTGRTGQWSYNGAVMHPSEFVGGGLERYILATPGLYVTLVIETWPENSDDDGDAEPELIGWAIAFRETDES